MDKKRIFNKCCKEILSRNLTNTLVAIAVIKCFRLQKRFFKRFNYTVKDYVQTFEIILEFKNYGFFDVYTYVSTYPKTAIFFDLNILEDKNKYSLLKQHPHLINQIDLKLMSIFFRLKLVEESKELAKHFN